MSARFTVTIECDHLGCEAVVEGRDGEPAHVRRVAHRKGWTTASKKKFGRFTDYCPDHADLHRPVTGHS